MKILKNILFIYFVGCFMNLLIHFASMEICPPKYSIGYDFSSFFIIFLYVPFITFLIVAFYLCKVNKKMLLYPYYGVAYMILPVFIDSMDYIISRIYGLVRHNVYIYCFIIINLIIVIQAILNLISRNRENREQSITLRERQNLKIKR